MFTVIKFGVNIKYYIFLILIKGKSMSKLNDVFRRADGIKSKEKIEIEPSKFTKPAISLDMQIEKLKAKGMLIADDEKKNVKAKLSIINYYRFEAYWYPFYNPASEKFTTNVSFDLILKYYRFDNEFRMLVFNAISHIEIAFRTQFSYKLSLKYGPHVLLEDSLFFNYNNWYDNLEKSKKSYDTENEDFITHFKNYYIEELPPIWAHVEFMAFGELISWWYLLLDNEDRKNIIEIFQLKTSLKIAKSFFENLRVIRNYCAHHSRLWNRAFVVQITQLKKGNNSKYSEFWNKEKSREKRIFNSLIIIDHLLNSLKINDFNIITETLKLTQRYEIDNINEMGFPENFK
jgi:abortive infection bacteriophage resistance protein